MDSDAILTWIQGFGSGWRGLTVVAMVLTAWTLKNCLPSMWKDWLEYRRSMRETDEKVKRLELKIVEKLEKMGAHPVLELKGRR